MPESVDMPAPLSTTVSPADSRSANSPMRSSTPPSLRRPPIAGRTRASVNEPASPAGDIDDHDGGAEPCGGDAPRALVDLSKLLAREVGARCGGENDLEYGVTFDLDPPARAVF